LTINYNGAISYITLTKGVPVSGTIAQGGVYWYRFVAPKTRSYTFFTTGSTDTYGELYQGSTLLQSNDDGGLIDSGYNFAITRNLTAGTEYLLKVRGYSTSTTGSYNVMVGHWPSASSPTIKSRSAWGAQSPAKPMVNREVANTKRVIFHHTADYFTSTNTTTIANEIKKVQTNHINAGFQDIGYHFIIDPAGNIWQGRAMGFKGQHTHFYQDNIGVVLLGDFEPRWQNGWLLYNTVNQNQVNAMQNISKWLCYSFQFDIVNTGIDTAPIATHMIVHTSYYPPLGRPIDPKEVCPGEQARIYITDSLIPTIKNWGL
ncbi:MAG: N-acetylmuramoyl-L-alanine amidase, partial [Peptococcaceae bacterium]|nr:N-acetylmuramoyl-L-alanine amidase [Peptococcaceae bacterium]